MLEYASLVTTAPSANVLMLGIATPALPLASKVVGLLIKALRNGSWLGFADLSQRACLSVSLRCGCHAQQDGQPYGAGKGVAFIRKSIRDRFSTIDEFVEAAKAADEEWTRRDDAERAAAEAAGNPLPPRPPRRVAGTLSAAPAAQPPTAAMLLELMMLAEFEVLDEYHNEDGF